MKKRLAASLGRCGTNLTAHLSKSYLYVVFFTFICIAGATPTFARPAFNKSTDILLMQYDAGGDEDDIHCIAAYACMKLHSDLVGVNDYIVTGARRRNATKGAKGHELLTAFFGEEGPEWTSAWHNWTLSVTRVRDRVKPVLDAGGRVWVAEGGQSDFTADWLKALNVDGIPLSTLKTQVIVVQHSVANEKFVKDPADLAYVQKNTEYHKIADGNRGPANGTAGYATYNKHFYHDARSSTNPNTQAKAYWDQTHNFLAPLNDLHNPYMKVGGVDFSDTSELWWILELGADVDTIAEFWDRYVVNAPSQTLAATVTVCYDLVVPQAHFAAQELTLQLRAKGHTVARKPLTEQASVGTDICVVLASRANKEIVSALTSLGQRIPAQAESEGFSIRKTVQGSKSTYWVIGADAAGTMYGGLELAELFEIQEQDEELPMDRNPYMSLRSIKFNIPLDQRTPTYSYQWVSDAVDNNTLVMWEIDFWTDFIDSLAKKRYNHVYLWNLHPFPSMVRVPGYEKVALDDVHSRKGTRTITMDEKIAFWREVMRYGKDRNVDFSIFTWNIYALGTEGQYGITDDIHNPITIDYYRKSVKQMFATYPDLDGIGFTAGEHIPTDVSQADRETWARATYGQGVLDAVQAEPGRKITLIHRTHQAASIDLISDPFQALIDHPDVNFLFSYKYAQAHVFSTTVQSRCKDYVAELSAQSYKTIWTLRNDDNYVFRWFSPDFVREFIKNIPYEVSHGYYYGSDGWVWGREFLSKDPATPRQLDINKHGYHWMLFGRLSYNPEISNNRFIKLLNARFPEVSATQLFDAWQEASWIYPVTTGFHYIAADFTWYIEDCRSMKGRISKTPSGFHDVNCFISTGVHRDSGNLTIPQYVDAIRAGSPIDLTTPMEVSDRLHTHADKALSIIRSFPSVSDEELKQTIGDITAIALMGKYYAHKIRGATELALYRGRLGDKHKQAAIDELTRAADYWDQYAAAGVAQYINPIRMCRVTRCDWQATARDVKQDIEIARQSVNAPNKAPSVAFMSPMAGQRFPLGSNLEIEVAASDADGSIANVKLYLDGFFVRQEDTAPYVWGKNDAALMNLSAGTYRLKAIATDNDGASAAKTISITVNR